MTARVRPVPATAAGARGRSNRRKGRNWMDACVQALRLNGWPNAEVVSSNGRSDISGAGDVGIECKDVESWSETYAHLDQASRDAAARDLPAFVVWRKRRGKADPMEGICIQPARVFWAERQRMEELEEVEREYSRLLDRINARVNTPLIAGLPEA